MNNRENIFKSIMEENKDRIYRICCYYISSNEDRKDLYQEVFQNIWKGLKDFRGDSAVSTWIFRITVNTALSFITKKKKKKKQFDEYRNFLNSTKNNQEVDNKYREINILHKAIARLPIIDMIIISLVLEDIGKKEIAKITGLTEGNVRVRIHRAKEKLKKLIEGGPS